MSYNYHDKTVSIDVDKLFKTYNLNKGNVTLDDCVCILLAHEIGHHLHYENEDWFKIRGKEWVLGKYKYDIFLEKKAWEYGRKIVPKRLADIFDKANKHNLEIYKYNYS